jgi:anaerobic ribonucleoside-triphosphate reductase activating protein
MINVAGVLHNDLVNGPNLRTVLFVQGCNHHCKGCHNQHTWPIGTGTDFTADELVTELTKNPMDKGVTISGGEPLLQWEELLPVVQQLKDKQYHLMLYTGYTASWINNKISTDGKLLSFLALFDMIITEPYIESKRIMYKPNCWYGSSNQKVCKIDTDKLIEI